jgi:hypothetical protein
MIKISHIRLSSAYSTCRLTLPFYSIRGVVAQGIDAANALPSVVVLASRASRISRVTSPKLL